jgi:cytochrome c553
MAPDTGAIMLCIMQDPRGRKVISAHSRAARLVVCLLAPVCLLLVAGGPGLAGDLKVGRTKALMCQACHGLDGLSKAPDAPNIAGQTEQYIVAQLQAFKSGVRKNDAMSVVAPSLSDQNIEDLAAYYSAIEINIGKLPGQ